MPEQDFNAGTETTTAIPRRMISRTITDLGGVFPRLRIPPVGKELEHASVPILRYRRDAASVPHAIIPQYLSYARWTEDADGTGEDNGLIVAFAFSAMEMNWTGVLERNASLAIVERFN